jgi:hypothetical protein
MLSYSGGVKMSIVTDEKGNVFVDFQKMMEEELEQLDLDAPLTHFIDCGKVSRQIPDDV